MLLFILLCLDLLALAHLCLFLGPEFTGEGLSPIGTYLARLDLRLSARLDFRAPGWVSR